MRNILRKYPVWSIYLISVTCVAFYWLFWASDRYVSEANVVLESPQISAPSLNFQSLLSGAGASSSDMLLLRDHLLSVDMLKKISSATDFASQYSSKNIDIFSRLSEENVPVEELHDYYLKRVSVELDDYAQVLRIRVEAFDPKIAQDIVEKLLEYGELKMNTMGQRLAEDQVQFLENQVNKLATAFDEARKALLAYQNKNGLVSPTGTVESINAVVGSLEAQLANFRAKKMALLTFQSLRSSEVVRMDAEISALTAQISKERARMAVQSGGALNALSSEYQRLELVLQFAQESYSGALAALENTRIEAVRKLKQVSVLQSPTLPEYAVEPRRLYNVVVFAIIALFIGLMANMLILIVNDHTD